MSVVICNRPYSAISNFRYLITNFDKGSSLTKETQDIQLIDLYKFSSKIPKRTPSASSVTNRSSVNRKLNRYTTIPVAISIWRKIKRLFCTFCCPTYSPSTREESLINNCTFAQKSSVQHSPRNVSSKVWRQSSTWTLKSRGRLFIETAESGFSVGAAL